MFPLLKRSGVVVGCVGVVSGIQLNQAPHEESEFPWPQVTNPFSKSSASDQTYTQKLENHEDLAYYGVIKVGGQQIKAVIDTGSFELLVFGKNCSVCSGEGASDSLYDDSKSTRPDGALQTVHSYGSGNAYSVESFDKVFVGGTSIKSQQFWDVTDADMPILDGSFQSIFGVGPPSSAVSFALGDQEEVHKELAEMQAAGEDISDDVMAIVQHYDDMVDLLKNTTGVIQHLGIENMSTCLGQDSGSDGYYTWNDHATRDDPDKFLTLKVIGDYYWSAGLGDVKLGSFSLPENATKDEKSYVPELSALGCAGGNCSAIVDTGTSLIVAPSDVAMKIYDLADVWEMSGGTCENLTGLPDLHFTLNGEDFSLPPESYMGKVSGTLDEQLSAFMPHLHKKQQAMMRRKANKQAAVQKQGDDPWGWDDDWSDDWGDDAWGAGSSGGTCEPLVMTMDADSQFGQLWILGMPFFRKYYTTFHFKQGKNQPAAVAMSFSEADKDCNPGQRPSGQNARKKASSRAAQLRINAKSIRIPSMAKKNKVSKPQSLLGRADTPSSSVSSTHRPFYHI